MGIIGHYTDYTRLRPSLKRIAIFENWLVPIDEKELHTFLYQLLYIIKFIPGRADIDKVLKTAIIQEVVEFRQGDRKRKTTKTVGFE